VTVVHQAPLSAWTTFGVGGPATRLVEVADVAGLVDALAQADREGAPVLVLGGGSNVLVSDEGFAGTVVRVGLKGGHAEVDGVDVLLTVGAGEDWATFVHKCVAEGLSGVECLSGIPGLVGGAPVQNIGAYGQEVRNTIEAVGVWDRVACRSGRLLASECHFAYRDSIFKHNERYVVTEVLFRLQRSSRSQPLRYAELAEALGCPLGRSAPLAQTALAVWALRTRKGMVLDPDDPDTRSAGSFFTNPVLDDPQLESLRRLGPDVPTFPGPDGCKVPAAWLVEGAGFRRGYRKGTAAISSKHALALTAGRGGTAADVVALAREVRDGVREHFGVVLEPEPVLVGLHL
jgi:UDP-N-acetylmuramate dehydrogenase